MYLSVVLDQSYLLKKRRINSIIIFRCLPMMLCEMFILYNTKFDPSHIKNTGGRQLRNGHLNELVKLESKDIVLR